MELNKAMNISANGMRAQSTRLRVISENLANANTAAPTAAENPYRRKVITFSNELDKATGASLVKIKKVDTDKSDFQTRFEPGHPSADASGLVKYPNVNSVVEMVDMREAQRSYEANISSLDIAKTMLTRTIDLLR
ncbi:MAG: flagellar basal body rod protein FlgC [Alphaproteobacteria bacterium]